MERIGQQSIWVMWSDWQQKIFSDILLASWLDKDSGRNDTYDMLRTSLWLEVEFAPFASS